MQEWGRSGDLCYCLIGWTNWPAFLVYVFCLSLVFSLNMHLLDLPVMDVCCGAISFDLYPWLWIIRIQKLLLTWGSSMGFLLLFFPLYPHPCLSCLSIFITPLQVFMKSNVRRSLRWLKMHQGWFLTEGIPLMKRMKGHTAVRQITHNSHPHCPGHPQTQTVHRLYQDVLKSQKEKSTLTSLVLQNLTHWSYSPNKAVKHICLTLFHA